MVPTSFCYFISQDEEVVCEYPARILYVITNSILNLPPVTHYSLIHVNSSLPKIQIDPWSNQWFDVVEEFENNVIKPHDPRLQSLLHDQYCNSFYNYMNIPKGYGYAIVGNSAFFRCSKLPIPRKEMGIHFHWL